MKIKTTYATFEQAKWLFEDKFPNNLEVVYVLSDTSRVYSKEFIKEGLFFSAPEQWQVVKWFELKYKINIFVIRDGGHWISKYQNFSNEQEESPKEKIIAYKYTKEDAYSAAFDYLKTII